MELKVIRKWFSTKSTIGEILVNDEVVCYSLEDVARPAGVKIYGETAIPVGKYNVEITHSNRYNKPLPLIFNTADLAVEDGYGVRFTGVRIHPGNTDKDTHGCLLPGTTKGDDFVGNSRSAFQKLMELIQEATDNEEEITIEYLNQQEGV